MRKDLEILIQEANPEITTVIFTTGYSLDTQKAHKLKNAGVGCVTIGIESADPKTHDKTRGRIGSFIEGKNAAAACLNENIFTAIGTVATRERITTGELERIYDLAYDWNIHEIRVIAP